MGWWEKELEFHRKEEKPSKESLNQMAAVEMGSGVNGENKRRNRSYLVMSWNSETSDKNE